MTIGWNRRASAATAHALLFTTLVLPCLFGAIAAYVAVMLVCLGVLLSWDKRALVEAGGNIAVRMLAFAFVLIAAAFAIGANSSAELAYILNYLPLLLVAPALALHRTIAGPGAGVVVAWLAWAGALAAVLVGIYDVEIRGLPRAEGYGSSPIHYADMAVLLGFIALGGTFAGTGRARWVFALGPFLGLAAALLGGTRGALVAGAGLLPVAAFFLVRAWPGRKFSPIALAAAVGGLILVAGTGLVVGYERVANLVAVVRDVALTGATSDASTYYRLEFYQAGLSAFLDSPLVGHGWTDKFTAAIPYMSEKAAALYTEGANTHLHNEFLTFASAGGLVAILAYVLILAAPIAGAWASGGDALRPVRIYSSVILSASFFFMGLTDVLFLYETTRIGYFLVLAVILGYCQERPDTAG